MNGDSRNKKLKMDCVIVMLLVALFFSAECKPLYSDTEILPSVIHKHAITKRIIDPMLAMGVLADGEDTRIRYKRSEDECEKLALCKLHARSTHSFFAAYELYFVNKENARLWDHQPHSIEDCERQFSYCYDKK